MAGIIPNITSGALTVRDADGTCLSPAGVSNAYCPDPDFTSSCEITYLPDGCSARITAAQINAFQSELLCLAETFSPDGFWNCGSLCNLSAAFGTWLTGSGVGSLKTTVSSILCTSTAMTQVAFQAQTGAGYIICDEDGVLRKVTKKAFTDAAAVATAICASPAAITSLQTCLEIGDTLCTEIAALPMSADSISVVPTGAVDCCPTGVSFADGTFTLTMGSGLTLTTPIITEVCPSIALLPRSATGISVVDQGVTNCCPQAMAYDTDTSTLTLTLASGASITTTVQSEPNLCPQIAALPTSATGISVVDQGVTNCCPTALAYNDASNVLTLSLASGLNLTATLVPDIDFCAHIRNLSLSTSILGA